MSAAAAVEIPTLDLRVSEFSPDRNAASACWAASELDKRRRDRAAEARVRDEFYAEMFAASAEILTQRRLEAIKRGEVYSPPPPPLPLSASTMPMGTGVHMGTGYYRR